MMKFLRSQSQTVLVLVLVVIAFGFLFYGNAGNFINIGSARTSNDFGRIDGEDLTVADIYDAVREERDSIIISGGSAQLQQPGMTAQVARGAWTQLLLLHEADRLHINISPEEIVDFIRKMPMFQKNGVFDLDTYNARMKDLQVLLHVTPEEGIDPTAATKTLFENLIRDTLRTEAVQNALFDSVRSSAHDVAEEYGRLYGPTTLSYVVFDPKTYVPQLKVSEADIEAAYHNNPTNPAYRTQEKRKVDYVLFMLTPGQQKLPEDQKQAAKDALGQKALNFLLAFQPNPSADPGTPAPNLDFMTEAKKENLAPGTTAFFAPDQSPAGLPPSPAFNQAAFALSKDNALSKVVEMDNGLAVLHLDEIEPSALLPLAQVKDQIQKDLLQKDAKEAAKAGATISAKLLEAALAKGTSFIKAAASLNQKVVTVPAFVPNSAKDDPTLGTLAYQAVQLNGNQLSKPFDLPNSDSLAILHLDNRGQPDPAGLADFEKQYRQRRDQQLRALVLNDWVNWKCSKPGTTRPPPQLDAYGSVE